MSTINEFFSQTRLTADKQSPTPLDTSSPTAVYVRTCTGSALLTEIVAVVLRMSDSVWTLYFAQSTPKLGVAQPHVHLSTTIDAANVDYYAQYGMAHDAGRSPPSAVHLLLAQADWSKNPLATIRSAKHFLTVCQTPAMEFADSVSSPP